MRKRVLTIVGTRPEAIKLAPVWQALRDRPDEFEPRLCVTGQHREMLWQMLSVFGLVPDSSLDVMKPNQSLADLTATVLVEVTKEVVSWRPDWLVVQGDTTTAMAGAMAAFYQKVPVAHVEAGLRTGSIDNPFPEEINRRVIDAVAELLFAPTESAAENLLREGKPPRQVHVTGNTVVDALHWMCEQPPPVKARELLAEAGVKRVILVTAHRRESFGAPLEDVCEALRVIALKYKDTVHVVFPVHLNPNVQSVVWPRLGGLVNVSLVSPLDYAEFVGVMAGCFLIASDSGGVQEEAPSLGKPVLVLRDTTEREEAVRSGHARLVGTAKDAIVEAMSRLLDDEESYGAMARPSNLFGDGRSGTRIATILSEAP